MELFNGGNSAALSYHVSTRYKFLSVSLSKFSRSVSVFLWIFNFFQTSYFTKQLQNTDCKELFSLFRMPNGCCFRWATQGQLRQCNRRNIVTVFRTVVKSHKGVKGTKVFACGCFGRNLKKFPKFAGKSPWWSPFIVKLRPVIAFKKTR